MIYCLQYWNPETQEWEGEMIWPEKGNLAEEYPGGYKYWKRREWPYRISV